MSLKITHWSLVLIGASIMALGLYFGGVLLAQGIYVTGDFIDILKGSVFLLLLEICGGILMGSGMKEHSKKNTEEAGA